MKELAGDAKDRLYVENLKQVRDFEFNQTVTRVFDDMVRRSVPGYDTIVQMIGVLGLAHASHVGRSLVCVDYGCSRGAVVNSLLTHMADRVSRIHAIDNSSQMIEAAQTEVSDARVSFAKADILDFGVTNSDLVVLNLVLQFIEPRLRLGLLERIRGELAEDGMLILTEKIQTDTLEDNYHLAFKRAMGYSELEITQKRDALERVMVIDSLEDHEQRLMNAGFSKVQVWFRLLNWASFIVFP